MIRAIPENLATRWIFRVPVTALLSFLLTGIVIGTFPGVIDYFVVMYFLDRFFIRDMVSRGELDEDWK
jgi:hypothetical protein